jgi:energy-coupling factor transport system permease protein
VWALAAVVSLQIAPNPYYVALVIAIAALVVDVHGRATAIRRAFPTLVVLGVTFGILRVVLTAVTTHAGPPLAVTLPAATLPRLLGGFTVGGAVAWTVLLRAAAESFVVVGIMAAFGAFNAVAAHDELLQRAPRAFHEPGLVVAVALSFVPATIASARDAREADRARTGGRIVRRGRLLRLVVPVLETGLERAAHLADSMDARGFGRLPPGPGDAAAAWVGLGALLGLGGAFVALVGGAPGVAMVLALAGLAGVAAAVALASGARSHTRHRPRPLRAVDAAIIALSIAAPLAVAAAGHVVHASLYWHTDPLHPPGFSPLAAVALMLLAAPIAVAP